MRLHYYQSNNFGDALSPMLAAKLSGDAVEYADAYVADVVGAGSVLYTGHWLFRNAVYNRTFRGAISWMRLKCRVSRKPIKIWGSGFLQYPSFPCQAAIVRKADVLALRGKLSHQIMDKLELCPLSQKVVYGDPGLLYPKLMDSLPDKEYVIGVIPHYMDSEKGRLLFEAIRATGASTLFIDVMDANPLETIGNIAKCETIVSSSLHGCIVADALGIPNRQMSLSTFNLSRDEYALKFRDYYSALDIEWPIPLEKLDFGNNVCTLPDRVRREYAVSQDKVCEVKSAIEGAFPV